MYLLKLWGWVLPGLTDGVLTPLSALSSRLRNYHTLGVTNVRKTLTSRAGLLAALLLAVASSAMAQTGGGTGGAIDYAALASSTKDEAMLGIVAVGAVAFLVLGTMAAIKWGWKTISKALAK